MYDDYGFFSDTGEPLRQSEMVLLKNGGGSKKNGSCYRVTLTQQIRYTRGYYFLSFFFVFTPYECLQVQFNSLHFLQVSAEWEGKCHGIFSR